MSLPAAKLLPGEFYVSIRGEMIVTVLGSCISACVRDRVHGIGGMNHFMLPAQNEFSSSKWGNSTVSSSSRYGNWAMEYLINEILKAGGERRYLEVKIFGGGNVLSNMTDIGKRNIEFVEEYVAREGLSIIAKDVGDIYPRKVLYFPDTGAVKMRKLRSVQNDTLISRERAYLEKIKQRSQDGGVELFD